MNNATRKWISAQKYNKFNVLDTTVNIAEKFYTKLCSINVAELDYPMDNKSIRLWVNEYSFIRFHKIIHEVNVIIITSNTAIQCLGDFLKEYYESDKRLDSFLVINERGFKLISLKKWLKLAFQSDSFSVVE